MIQPLEGEFMIVSGNRFAPINVALCTVALKPHYYNPSGQK